ncbi:tripartite tricarboxylate transporter substrate-binding protein [Xenophilus arseniciresistens]|uniref:Tripartite tricarboxylate transporter substrate-binding protein n=1 Tax=Xenophilus arseniciresistens TaxID=1283306 RepID=A0AAE3N5V5_9BURK|nr:tripartite tricarboxylate transporter substrate-binding protein [Xenophilus arseniciresistens]MDA7415153.1 tripartite tricarboxylate transporter substrate-binding protein [Xenophilus arseniciresistens]
MNAIHTPRHRLLCTALLAALGTLASPAALAADAAWPAQPITILVPYSAGGNVDVVARWVAPGLAQRLGQSVVVENLPGAGGVIGTDKVARAKPDGYTLLMSVESTIVIAKMVTPSTVRYDGLRDLMPVTLLGAQPLALVGRPGLAARNAGELFRDMKAHPGKYSYATSGVGTSLHLGGELLKQQGNVSMVHVPYRVGSQIVTDLAGNQLDLAVLPLSMVMQQAKADQVRVFGVLDGKASPVMPEVPVLGASEPAWRGAEVTVWQGIFAPRGTPAEVIARLDQALRETLAEPAVRKNFTDSGVTPMGLGPQPFASFIQAEHQKFGAIVAKGQIKAE